MSATQRPVMLSEVSFSAPSTNTSFPAYEGVVGRENLSYSSGPDFEEVEMTDNEIAAPYGAPSPQYRQQMKSASPRCESPTPRRMELSQERRMLHQSAVSSQRHKTPAADLPPKDFGRSPSPEPFRNYESMDGTATMTSMDESVSTSAPSTSRSDRIRHMTARIEYLHSHHAPSQSPVRTQYTVRGGAPSLHREEVNSSCEETQFGPHRRPRSPTGPATPISRKTSEPRSVPRAHRPSLLTHEGEACLREIDESLDELKDLLPTAQAQAALDTSSTSTTNSRRRVMRINELCTKLDGLASIAYEMRAVAERQRQKYAGRPGEKNKQLARELDHFLEQISRKADSMAYLLEQLGSGSPAAAELSRPTTGNTAVSASTADYVEPTTAPMPRATATAMTEDEEAATSFTATTTSSSAGRKYRQLLSKKHTTSVMDTIEMMADTVLRLADRLDNQNEALMAAMEHQQDQKDDVELCKAVLHEICINGGPVEYEGADEYQTVTSCTATAEEEYEGDYVARAINDTTASTMVEQHDMEVEALRVEQAEVRDLPVEFPVSPARSRGQHESMMVAPAVNRSLYAESSVPSSLAEQREMMPDTLTETATDLVEEEEDGYVLMENSRLTESSSNVEHGYSTADRFVDDVSPRRTNRTPMPKIHVDQPTASSISRHSASALQTSVIAGASPRSAPHRRILTPSTSRPAVGGATMTATLMSPHDESGEALHTSRVSALATQPKLNMHQSQSPATLRSHAYPAASLNTSLQSAETAEVSRSLFLDGSNAPSSRPSSKSSSTKRSAQRERESYLENGHPYNLVDRDSDVDGGLQPQALFDAAKKMKVDNKGVPQLPVGTTISVSKKRIPSVHRDIFASEPVALEVEKRSAKDSRYKKAFAQLRKENQSLKDQLDAALNHKDHWRQVAQDGYSEVLNNTTGISPAH